MPAAPSVTKAQLERDLLKVEQELAQVESQKEALNSKEQGLRKRRELIKGMLEEYFEARNDVIAKISSAPSLDHFSIAEACKVVFRDLGNEWLSLADLDTELRHRGKICSKGSIEIMLKGSDGFELEKRGKRNFYRMKED